MTKSETRAKSKQLLLIDELDHCLENNLPIALKVGLLGRNYDEWVHGSWRKKKAPRPTRFFKSDLLESMTHNQWWVVPLVWVPIIVWLIIKSILLFDGNPVFLPLCLATSFLVYWPLVEYCLHRFIFHAPTETYLGNTLHFLFHGNHHVCPDDPLRLVFPVSASLVIALAFHAFHESILGNDLSYIWTGGTAMGYLSYDMTHFAIHHFSNFRFLRELRLHHLRHHHHDPTSGFGVSSRTFDFTFGSIATKIEQK